MKKSVKTELRNKTIDDLRKLLSIKKQEQMKVILATKQGTSKLSGHPGRIRKEIAIIQTIINEKINKINQNAK